MSHWKRLLIKEFGKKAARKWMEAALDIKLVDKGIKPSLLFDHWGVDPDEMKNFLVSAQENQLIDAQIVLLVIGLDILLVNIKILRGVNHLYEEKSSKDKKVFFIDVSYGLKEPKIVDLEHKNVSCTYETFHALSKLINDIKSDFDVVNIEDLTNLASFNVPCMFGFLLGYPIVYWYDQKESEENCLSGVALRVFQILGVMDDLNDKDLNRQFRNSVCNTANQKKVILSFSIPENLKPFTHCHIHAWFSSWKSTSNWSSMFKDVFITEQVQQPQAVAL